MISLQNSKSIEEAILERARNEAEKMILEARMRAEQLLKNAGHEKNKKLESIRMRTIEEVNAEVERMQVKANTETKRMLQDKKNELLARLAEQTREAIEKREFTYSVKESLKNLLLEALPMFPQQAKLHIFVNLKDLNAAESVLKELNLSNFADVEAKKDMLGGVIVESSDGRLKVDNSYDTRLKRYMQSFLPDISRMLFES